MSEKILNVYQRMNAIMKEVTYIKKREKRPGMQYSFVAHDDVTALLHEPLAKHGIVVIPSVVEYKVETVTQKFYNKYEKTEREIETTRHIVKLSVSFVNIDDSSDKVVVEAFGYGIDDQDKGYGKAISYALKYVLLKSFMLESGDEDEIDAYQEPITNQLPKSTKLVVEDKLTDAMVNTIKQELNGNMELREEILKTMNVKLVSDIPYKEYQSVMNFIKKSRAA